VESYGDTAAGMGKFFIVDLGILISPVLDQVGKSEFCTSNTVSRRQNRL